MLATASFTFSVILASICFSDTQLLTSVAPIPVSYTHLDVYKRQIIPLEDGLKAELDVYYEDLAGFMNVEVEFPDMKKAVLFTPPDWFGQEVTQDKRYTNGSMSKYGVPKN